MLGPLIPGWKMEIEMRISGHGLSEITETTETAETTDINETTDTIETIGDDKNTLNEDGPIESVNVTEAIDGTVASTTPDILAAFEQSDALLSFDDITVKRDSFEV